jgi:hypothetical protein
VTVFGDLRAEYAAKLVAAGADMATTDPGANVPMVLIQPVTITGTQGVGAWTGDLVVSIVVPPPGDADAGAALEALLQVVLTTFPAPTSAVPGTYGPTELPAYTVTYPVTVPNPNC